MLTNEGTDEQTGITVLVVRFPNSLFDFKHESSRRFSKTRQNFSIRVSCLVRRDRQREGRTLRIEFYNFGTPLQMRCKSTEYLRNFWPSYREGGGYHITVSQVKIKVHAVH